MNGRTALATIAATAAFGLVAGLTIPGCGRKEATPASIAKATETFIDQPAGRFPWRGHTLHGATCELPADVIVGSRYVCAAADERGVSWEVFAVITSEGSYVIQSASEVVP